MQKTFSKISFQKPFEAESAILFPIPSFLFIKFSLKTPNKILQVFPWICNCILNSFSMTDIIDAEIFTDCDAGKEKNALIVNLNRDDPNYYIPKKIFWELFITSKPESYKTIIVDE